MTAPVAGGPAAQGAVRRRGLGETGAQAYCGGHGPVDRIAGRCSACPASASDRRGLVAPSDDRWLVRDRRSGRGERRPPRGRPRAIRVAARRPPERRSSQVPMSGSRRERCLDLTRRSSTFVASASSRFASHARGETGEPGTAPPALSRDRLPISGIRNQELRSSTARPSSAIERPSAAVRRRTVTHVGLVSPRSMRASEPTVMPASCATVSCERRVRSRVARTTAARVGSAPRGGGITTAS